MRSRFLALLLTMSLGASGWGQDYPSLSQVQSEEASEMHPSASLAYPGRFHDPGPDELEIGYCGSMATDCWLARVDDDYYYQADFLLWRASRPRENGVFIKSAFDDQTTNQPTINSFSTGKPNPDYEMGFRTFIGRRLNEFWSVELGGFWVHDYDFPSFFRRQADSSGNVSQGFLDPLSDPTVDPRFVAGADQRELTAAALIYEIETHGVELTGRVLLHEGSRWRIDGLAGLRYVDYDEKFGSRLTFPNGAVVDEKFHTENAYFGPQIGAEAWYRLARFVSIRGLAKFTFAANFQEVNVYGPVPGNGVLTGAGNLQGADVTEYATVVELGAGLVAHLTPYIQLSGGYDALWLSDALRAMDQLDLANVNGRNPILDRRSTGVWLRGLNASLRINY